MRIEIDEPDADERFWEGMRDVAVAATRYQDSDLYGAIVKIGRAALAQGVALVPSGGLFIQCPICESLPGQRCINIPRHPLREAFHPERIELVERALKGEVPPPVPLADAALRQDLEQARSSLVKGRIPIRLRSLMRPFWRESPQRQERR
ncbi:zinc finger domain-containing protein [Micromonospora costi]|uniref:zinc finger domain-containing protein n=1 Tax=Micromonospora costi TaxID=1530042 RepID=UPI0011C37CD1|nr:hypothetical protein [Micromonospora costi]